MVEAATFVGTIVIRSPFLEEEYKTVFVHRELSEAEFGFMSKDAKAKCLAGTSQVTAEYSVEAVIELKKLAKMVPENSIFTHQNAITGIKGCYLPREPTEATLKEANSVTLTFHFMQTHIP
jgi:hypothetical protein